MNEGLNIFLLDYCNFFFFTKKMEEEDKKKPVVSETGEWLKSMGVPNHENPFLKNDLIQSLSDGPKQIHNDDLREAYKNNTTLLRRVRNSAWQPDQVETKLEPCSTEDAETYAALKKEFQSDRFFSLVMEQFKNNILRSDDPRVTESHAKRQLTSEQLAMLNLFPHEGGWKR